MSTPQPQSTWCAAHSFDNAGASGTALSMPAAGSYAAPSVMAILIKQALPSDTYMSQPKATDGHIMAMAFMSAFTIY